MMGLLPLFSSKGRMKKRKNIFVWLAVFLIKTLLVIAGLALFLFGAINASMMFVPKFAEADEIRTSVEKSGEKYDYIMVLGASVRKDVPSHMLRDRLDKAIELYKADSSEYLLMTGDSSTKYYDEVGTMTSYARAAGVDADHILQDAYGLNTYESLRRARKEYGCGRILIVTQKYHIYRAVFLADMLGFEAVGVATDEAEYQGQAARDRREILARCKDFVIAHIDRLMGEESALAFDRWGDSIYKKYIHSN